MPQPNNCDDTAWPVCLRIPVSLFALASSNGVIGPACESFFPIRNNGIITWTNKQLDAATTNNYGLIPTPWTFGSQSDNLSTCACNHPKFKNKLAAGGIF